MGFLSTITKAAPSLAPRLYFYAPEKWGKTSFASFAPKPLFVMTEGETGLIELIDAGQVPPTDHFPEDFKSWTDMTTAIREFEYNPSGFETLVIDTCNGAERLLYKHVVETVFNGDDGPNGYGAFGAGDRALTLPWSQFLLQLDRIRAKGVNIILLAHTATKSISNPTASDYDRYQPEGMGKLYNLTHKWADQIAMGDWKVSIKDGKIKEVTGRVIKTATMISVVGGGRYGLPQTIDGGANAKTAFNNLWTPIMKVKGKGNTDGPITPPMWEHAVVIFKKHAMTKAKVWATLCTFLGRDVSEPGQIKLSEFPGLLERLQRAELHDGYLVDPKPKSAKEPEPEPKKEEDYGTPSGESEEQPEQNTPPTPEGFAEEGANHYESPLAPEPTQVKDHSEPTNIQAQMVARAMSKGLSYAQLRVAAERMLPEWQGELPEDPYTTTMIDATFIYDWLAKQTKAALGRAVK